MEMLLANAILNLIEEGLTQHGHKVERGFCQGGAVLGWGDNQLELADEDGTTILLAVAHTDQDKPIIEAIDEDHNCLFTIKAEDLTIEKLLTHI